MSRLLATSSPTVKSESTFTQRGKKVAGPTSLKSFRSALVSVILGSLSSSVLPAFRKKGSWTYFTQKLSIRSRFCHSWFTFVERAACFSTKDTNLAVMGVIVAIILMGLFSIAAGDPTSGQDYGLCSQVYIMNQYCTSQLGQTSTAVSHRHVRPPMRVKAGPRGPPGIVNKTEINETIAGRFSGWEVKMEEKFTALKLSTNEEVKVMKNGVENRTKEYATSMAESFSKWKNLTELTMDEMKENLTNKGKDLEDGIERKFMRWSREADSEMERMKAEIAIKKNEWQELKDQLDEMKGSLDSEMNKTSSVIANRTKDLEEKIESKFTSWRMEAESDMRRVKAWIEKRNVSCAITFNGICYWTHVEGRQYVYFARAEEICSNNASTPAHFPSERVYNAVLEDVRSKIPSGRSFVQVWTGVTINGNTGNVIHPSGDTYVKWHPGYPYTGSSYKTYTRVIIQVDSDPGPTSQGMFNYYQQENLNGVVCQIVE